MLDFLSEYYIWFFVAAVVLLFALIGFIVEGKKKKNKEFKGESINENVESTPTNNGLEVNDIPVQEPTANVQPEPTVTPLENIQEPQTISETPTIEPVQNTSAEQVDVKPVESSNITIGEPIQMQSEPVIPTAPESFYDEPLMPEKNEEQPMNFEINSNSSDTNERQ